MTTRSPKASIQDIYELSPMQEAMLFHSLYAPDSLAYFDQFNCVIEGELQPDVFREAWRTLAVRQPVLRTSFHWRDLPKPVQVVHDAAHNQFSVPWSYSDWSEFSPGVQKAKLQDLLEEDRRNVFRLDRSPLFRCHLVRLADQRYFFVWSHHHIILDGWCLSIILSELFEICNALRTGREPALKPVRPYRDYISWLQQHDDGPTREYWANELSNFVAPTELPGASVRQAERTLIAGCVHEIRLSAELSKAVSELAARNQLTPSTVVQGAWSILLHRYSGERRVLFGATVSGRPPELTGVENMLGVFINTLPVGVQVEPDSLLIPWLKKLQLQHARRLQHGYVSLSNIKRWSGAPGGVDLFHTNLILMNYPFSEEASLHGPSFEISEPRVFQPTDLPLTLQITPGRQWSIEAVYDGALFEADTIQRLLGHFVHVLEEFIAGSGRLVAAIVAALVELEQLPRTPDGKVDRDALPEPALARHAAGAEDDFPLSETEKILADIWSEVLGVDRPGRHDNFFSIGGDSILSMQVVSRARQAGLKIAVIDMFRYVTIADLAVRAVRIDTVKKASHAQSPEASGPLPLTPAQKRFFETVTADSHHYNQSLLIETPEDLNVDLLREALRLTVARHDSLHIRFKLSEGTWRQELPSSRSEVPLAIKDLSDLPEAEREAAIQSAAEKLHASFDLEAGPLMTAALFVRSAQRPASLLLIVHHLCIDGVSWRILLEDLLTAYWQLERGMDIHLPEPGSSYREWSNRLVAYARGEIGADEKRYWLGMLETGAETGVASIPVDFRAEAGANTVASAEELWVELDDAVTAALLKEVPRAYNAQIDDTLLTALALALSDWTGADRVLVDVENHGREALFDELDISRTTGWFTALFPLVLELRNAHNGLDGHLKSIKEQVRRVPKRGLGYGLLRCYPDDEGFGRKLAEARPAEVLFNYLGQADRLPVSGNNWRVDVESTGQARSRRQIRDHLIEVNGLVAGGRLKLSLTYSNSFHRRNTIERLASNLRGYLIALVEHCTRPEAGGFTPSDFPLILLSQESLDALFEVLGSAGARNQRPEIADIYGLSPVQQGMLFHSLYTADSNTYFNQLSCVIEGPIDSAVFRKAWEKVIEHHPALRTSFHWEGLESPVQVVHRSAHAEWKNVECCGLAIEERDRCWRDYLRNDRRRNFELARPPLVRFGLQRLDSGAHRFNWSYHHLLFDGWSLAIILNDVLTAYEALLNRRPYSLSNTRPFRENVEWLSRVDLAGAEAYWREKLKGGMAPTPLVLGKPELEGSANGGDYSEEEAYIGSEVSYRLHSLARERGITLNTLAQAAWALLLSRYGGEMDVVFGSIVSGRPPELEGADKMVGVFINTLPLRIRVDPIRPLTAWLEEMQIEQAEREQYAYSSLIDIHRWSDVPAGTPLFESILIFENYPVEGFLLQGAGGLSITQVQGRDPNNYSLTLVVTPGQKSAADALIALKIMYYDGRFDRATILRLLAHYEALIRRIAERPGQAIGEIDLLTESERRQILYSWNNTAVPFPEDKTFIHLFEEQAQSNPDHTAVKANGNVLSYRELNEFSNQIALRLSKEARIESGHLIAVLASRSEKMLASIIAIWKCRAAYVPLDPAYPLERIRTIIADSGARLVVCDSAAALLAEKAAGERAKVISISGAGASRGLASPGAPLELDSRPAPDDLAYVIYTSGSTGKPKGVMIEHRGMLNHILSMADELEIGPDSVVAQTASHCFDISVWQFLTALTAGGQTVIYSDETVMKPNELVERMSVDAVQVAQFVPSYLAVFLDELGRGRGALSRPGQLCDPVFRNLKWLVLIGEILKPAYVQRWFDVCPGIRLMNAYGPTEASDSVTHYVMESAPELPSIPIGRPIRNMSVYVLDERMNLCPVGVKGEICIGGVGVGRGYLGDEERTRAAFVDHPFAKDGGRLYKSGDIGCFTDDGNLVFFGRKDHQVKIRGHRLELGEIESTLARIDGVRNAAVVDRERQGQKSLVAYVSLGERTDKTPSDLAQALSLLLPAYMIPDVIKIIPELLLTPGGKVDRKRLPVVEIDDCKRPSVSPAVTATERMLARIWKDVLGLLNEPGIDDSFTDLGGHSLNAIQIVGRARKQLKRDISFADVFECNTLRLLAARADLLSEVPDHQTPPERSREYYDASHAQKRIWLACLTPEASAAYNMQAAVWVEGRLNTDALKEGFQFLFRRHESLRTAFVTRQGELRQRVLPPEQLDAAFEEIDLSGAGEAEAEASAIALKCSATPFDLTRGPLFKVALIRLRDDKHLLVATLHHTVGDAWSFQVIFDELLGFYKDRIEGRAPSPTPLKLQYRDYAAWQNRWLRSLEAEKERVFWLKNLLPRGRTASIPPDFPHAEPMAFRGASVRLNIGTVRAGELKRLAEKSRTTVYAVVLSAIYALVFRYTNQEDIVMGAQAAGRTRPDLEGQVGCFVNTLILRAPIHESDAASDVIRKTSSVLAAAMSHQSYPFDLILEGLRAQSNGSWSPLFEIQVDSAPNLAGRSNAQPEGLKFTELDQPKRTTKYPISFLIDESKPEGGLSIEIVYSTDLFKRESMDTLAERLGKVLEAFTEDVSCRIDTIELTGTVREARRVRVELNLHG